MSKQSWRPGTMIYPLPAVIVTVGASPEEWNPLTIAWTGTICSDPAMCFISVRKERYSFPILMKNMEFTINLTTADMARATDWIGVRSGRDYDKWKESGLTPIPGEMVASPTIEESPLSIECRVKSVTDLGSHHMFVADVVNVRADSRWIDPESGRFELEKSDLMTYCHGHYYHLGEMIGKFGFSVKKEKE
ncbi:MAG: flavin reductase family protein [Muribaculaceae bacterium]|nr:flavin reductase family protein [Bacteroidales bacterium]MDY5387436.1 flavin reductase family protein [Muribaculaceae bacterium]